MEAPGGPGAPPHRGRAWSAGGFHRVLSMERAWGRIESNDGPELSGRWLSGRKHPPAKRVGGVKLPRGFESLPSRSQTCWRHQARSDSLPILIEGPFAE